MIRLLALTGMLTLLFACVIGVLHAQPYRDPITANIGGCAVSCWQGVEPGRSLSTDSLDRLNMEYGAQPTSSSCFDLPSNFCNRFTWRSSDAARTTELMINHDRVQSILIFRTDFTLGDVLLTLNDFHHGFYGASPTSIENQHFYFQLTFDDTRIGLSMTVPCPASYFVMMHTPINGMNVGIPTSNAQAYFGNNFAFIRQKWYQFCEA